MKATSFLLYTELKQLLFVKSTQKFEETVFLCFKDDLKEPFQSRLYYTYVLWKRDAKIHFVERCPTSVITLTGPNFYQKIFRFICLPYQEIYLLCWGFLFQVTCKKTHRLRKTFAVLTNTCSTWGWNRDASPNVLFDVTTWTQHNNSSKNEF